MRNAPVPVSNQSGPKFPSADELAALRAWYAGLPARQVVERYLGQKKATGQSSRAMLTAIRRQLAQFGVISFSVQTIALAIKGKPVLQRR